MSKLEDLRKIPHSVEAEQALLGGLLVDSKHLTDICEIISEEDLYLENHKIIFRSILNLDKNNLSFDAITLISDLEKNNLLEAAGGQEFIADLTESVLTGVNILSYAKIVREKAILRHIIDLGRELVELGFQPNSDNTEELLDTIQSKALHLATTKRSARSHYRLVKEVTTKAVDQITELANSKDGITGLKTPFTNLDKATTGLHEGELIVIAARPSMGKTALALDIIAHLAVKEKKTVGFFSMEMPAEQLVMRMTSALGAIKLEKLRTGKLSNNEWNNFSTTVSQIGDSAIFIDDSASLTPLQLKSRARNMMNDGKGLDLIVVDYLQLLKGVSKVENRVNEIAEISRMLKECARELKLPVIALSQLNRNLETRTNKRPMMADLRESGAIEQDADLVLFIYRDEVYNSNSEEKGVAELIIGKQRNGPIGTVKLAFLGELTSFKNYNPI